jgi:hypothetical protein
MKPNPIRSVALVAFLLVLCSCSKSLATPKKNPDMGTKGGATQVDTETH